MSVAAAMTRDRVFGSGAALPGLPSPDYPANACFIRTSDFTMWRTDGSSWVSLAPPFLHASQHAPGGTDQIRLGPTIYGGRGLRRFRGQLGDALYTRAPVICVGDSIVAGVGGHNSGTFDDTIDNTQGWVGQLRQLFAKTYGDPGEGYLFSTTGACARVSANTGTGQTNTAPLKIGTKLVNGQSVTYNIPAGCTAVDVMQPNVAGDITLKYVLDGGPATDVVTLTGTGNFLTGTIPVASGSTHTLQLNGPATSQSYLTGIALRNGSVGVPVHRIGIGGDVIGDCVGGQTSGVLGTSGATQLRAIRAHYQWETSPGVVIVSFGTNDYVNQGNAGVAGGITPTLFGTWLQLFANQAIADNWCVLFLGEPRSPSTPSGSFTERNYMDAAKAVALATDHVAFLDIGEMWGTQAEGHTTDMGLQLSASVHPTRKGHGDIARTVHKVLTGYGLGVATPA